MKKGWIGIIVDGASRAARLDEDEVNEVLGCGNPRGDCLDEAPRVAPLAPWCGSLRCMAG